MTFAIPISASCDLPLDTVTATIGVIATKGSGKTYFATVLAEGMLLAKAPVVIFDPVGVMWGLTSSASGTKPGFAIPVLGGDQGRFGLLPAHGKRLAALVAKESISMICDMSLMRKAEQQRFMLSFTEELYHSNRNPVHLIVDEADLYVPQTPDKEGRKLLNAFEDIVRRGRARGIGCTMITQRPAVINKNVLTQISALVTLRIGGPQDRDAIRDWIRFHGDESEQREVLESLASLPIGTAWIWSPGWLRKLQKVKVRKKYTWDSSATPKMGEERKMPSVRAKIPDNVRALLSAAMMGGPKRVIEPAPRLSSEIIEDLDTIAQADESQESPGIRYLHEFVAWYRKQHGCEAGDEEE